MGQEQSAPCELRQQSHSHPNPQQAGYSNHSHSHSGHSHSGHGYSGHSCGSGAEDGYSHKSKATHYCSSDSKSKSQYCTSNSDKSSATNKTHYCDKNSNYNYSASGTDSCGTGSSKYSRNCSDYSHHPDPGLKRTKGSLSSGCNSSILRTDSNASAESRNPRLPIYTNVHYRDVNNNDIYKPLKIGKNKIHRLKILNAEKDTAIYLEKHLSIKSYLDKDKGDKKINKGPQLPEPELKKSGIRNYTPKILSEKKMQKDLEHWI